MLKWDECLIRHYRRGKGLQGLIVDLDARAFSSLIQGHLCEKAIDRAAHEWTGMVADHSMEVSTATVRLL